MNANQFRVVEHYSYDMIGVMIMGFRQHSNHQINNNCDRLYNALVESHTIDPYRCRMYLFPYFQFDAKEYAKR